LIVKKGEQSSVIIETRPLPSMPAELAQLFQAGEKLH